MRDFRISVTRLSEATGIRNHVGRLREESNFRAALESAYSVREAYRRGEYSGSEGTFFVEVQSRTSPRSAWGTDHVVACGYCEPGRAQQKSRAPVAAIDRITIQGESVLIEAIDAQGYRQQFLVPVICGACGGTTGVEGGLECPDCEDGLHGPLDRAFMSYSERD